MVGLQPMRLSMCPSNQTRQGMPVSGGGSLPPTAQVGRKRSCPLNMDARIFSARTTMRMHILKYLNKRPAFVTWEESTKDAAAKMLEHDLYTTSQSLMDHTNLSTLEHKLDILIRDYANYNNKKQSACNISSSYVDLEARTSQMPSDVKVEHEGPFPQNAAVPTIDCSNVQPNVVSQPFLNQNFSLAESGLCASQRYLPNEHHRVVAHISARHGGNVMHCPQDKPGVHFPQPAPMGYSHYDGGGLSDVTTVVSPNQYIAGHVNYALQNNCDKGRSSMSQMPSSGIYCQLSGEIADANTCSSQAIDTAPTAEGSMTPHLSGDVHLMPDPKFSHSGVSNNPSSYRFSRTIKDTNPSLLCSYPRVDSAVTSSLFKQQAEQPSTQKENAIQKLPTLLETSISHKSEIPDNFNRGQKFLHTYLYHAIDCSRQPTHCGDGYCKSVIRLVHHMHMCNEKSCNCKLYQNLLCHYRECQNKACDFCGPVRIRSQQIYQKNYTAGMPLSKAATPSISTMDCFQRPLKRPKMGNTCTFHSYQTETSQISPLIVDQYHFHQGHTRVCSDSRKLDADPFASSSKERHAHFSEVKPECLEEDKVLVDVEPINSVKIVPQCEEENKQVQVEPGKLEMEVECKPSASTHVCPEMRTSESKGTGNGNLDPNPFACSSEERRTKNCEAKVKDSEEGKVLFDVKNSGNSVAQCEEDKRKLKWEPGKFKLEVECKLSALSHVCPEIRTSESKGIERWKTVPDPFASASKERKAEDSDGKVLPCVKPVNSDNIVAQCEKGKEQVQMESDELKMEVKYKISTSAADHLLETKVGKRKLKGLSLIDSFTPEQIREHIRSLRQSDDQENAMVEINACSLCGMVKLLFEPPPRYCGSCSKLIYPKGIFYSIIAAHSAAYGGNARNSFCSKCYNTSGDAIKAGEVVIPKANLVRCLDYAETDSEDEWWVQCDKCKDWQHQICALFNGKMNQDELAEYTCPSCFLQELETGICKPLPQNEVFAADNLPTAMLSDHIEQWLFRRLEKERRDRANALRKSFDEVPGAEGLVVRVVSSVDKKCEVKEHFRELFHEEEYPAEFPYKSKVILLFQKIDGADVCLFGMYVQEFGSECALPNQRRVCVSYIDSVRYFRPEIKTVTGEALRTFVYHEILIGYLDYCKKRGFTSCYIWSCPSLKKDDYIIYCHPRTQKMPKSDKLREWYQTIIRKAAKENIVVENTNLYDHFFKRPSDCKAKVTATHLPYFDSDYWPGEAEILLQKGGESMPQKKVSEAAKERVLRAAKRDSLIGNPKDILLMHQLGEIIRPIKENFIMVYLQHTCKHCYQPIVSGNRWVRNGCKHVSLCDKCYYSEQKIQKDRHSTNTRKEHSYRKVEMESVPVDTSDKDEILQSEYFDTRMVFLSLCQGNHYQFDTLRRAKHSTMMILYHLHNPTVPTFISSCVVCHCEINTAQGWHCKTCPDYDICDACYERGVSCEHHHELVSHATMPGCNVLPYKRKRGQQQLLQIMDVLVHASKCKVGGCGYPYCTKLKGLFRHSALCRIRVAGGCKYCNKIWFLLKTHCMSCKELECMVPRCRDLKDHKRKEHMHSDARRRAGVNERFRQEAGQYEHSQ